MTLRLSPSGQEVAAIDLAPDPRPGDSLNVALDDSLVWLANDPILRCWNDGIVSDVALFKSQIAAYYAAGFRYLTFATGIYYFDEQIDLSEYDNLYLSFQAGSVIKCKVDKTLIHNGGDIFIFQETLGTTTGSLVANAVAGSTTVEVNSIAGLTIGEVLSFSDSNEMFQIRKIANLRTTAGPHYFIDFDKPFQFDMLLANGAGYRNFVHRPTQIVLDGNNSIISGDCYRFWEYIGCDQCKLLNWTTNDMYATAAGRVQILGSFDDRCTGCYANNIISTQEIAAISTSNGFLLEGVEDCLVENSTIDFLVDFYSSAFSFLSSVTSSYVNCIARGSSTVGGGGFLSTQNVGPGWSVNCSIINCKVYNVSGGVYLGENTQGMTVTNLIITKASTGINLINAHNCTISGYKGTSITACIQEDNRCSGNTYSNVTFKECGNVNASQEVFQMNSDDFVISGGTLDNKTVAGRIAACSGTKGRIFGLTVTGLHTAIQAKANSQLVVAHCNFLNASPWSLEVAANGRMIANDITFDNNTYGCVYCNGVLELSEVRNFKNTITGFSLSEAAGSCIRTSGKNNFNGPFAIPAYAGNIQTSNSSLKANFVLAGAPIAYAFKDISADEFVGYRRVANGGTTAEVAISITAGVGITITPGALDTSTIQINIGGN